MRGEGREGEAGRDGEPGRRWRWRPGREEEPGREEVEMEVEAGREGMKQTWIWSGEGDAAMGMEAALGLRSFGFTHASTRQGVNDIHHLVKDVLDKRMSSWEKYCHPHCFTVPEGFMAPDDDNSSAKESHKDGHYDSDLDAELDSLRRKLENANKESEELQREISSLERQSTYKRNLNSSIAEVLKLFEDKSVRDNIQDLVNAIPKFHEKMKGMKRKKAESESMVGQNVWNVNGLRDKKRLALGFAASTEDIQEVVNGLRKV